MSVPACAVQRSGQVELYFYGELAEAGRSTLEAHFDACGECRQALDDLCAIQAALAARPDVSAPPEGDWTGFMARLDRAVAREAAAPQRTSVIQMFAMAALVALVTISVFVAARAGRMPAGDSPERLSARGGARAPVADRTAGHDVLAAVGERHLERSKLVLLGLTSKDAARTPSREWQYERDLASRLLADTRLYRLAAEEEGLARMAGVMRDLEFVLLQTSMTEGRNASELSQIQRAIHKRDLLHKMDFTRAAN